MTDELKWPERPICHDGHINPIFKIEPITWRPASEDPARQPFRTCSYCGSIHPEDLVKAIAAGAKLGGSDWKYGWPHKFYISEIPNPNAGKLVCRISGSGPLPLTDADRSRFVAPPGGRVEFGEDDSLHIKRWTAQVFEPDGPTTHGKWYNDHLMDLSDEAFAIVAPLLEQHAGIRFKRDAKGLGYAAPHAGYQR